MLVSLSRLYLFVSGSYAQLFIHQSCILAVPWSRTATCDVLILLNSNHEQVAARSVEVPYS